MQRSRIELAWGGWCSRRSQVCDSLQSVKAGVEAAAAFAIAGMQDARVSARVQVDDELGTSA
ncbi:MAG: hypothetical protein GY953_45180 [bacterium]|nr:hypothetical protein [bacterium]